MIPAIVLCGGLATRLRGVLDDKPKALADIGGRPFLDYLLASFHRDGISRVVLSTGHLGHMIDEFVGDGSRWGMSVETVQEREPLGTGGAIRFAAEQSGIEGRALVANGDTFFGGSLRRLVDQHDSDPSRAATMALVSVPDGKRYGNVELDECGRVIRFAEKSPETGKSAGPAMINAGVYVLDAELIQSIPMGEKVSLEREVFPKWVPSGIGGCTFPDAIFLDIGTPTDLARAPDVLASLKNLNRTS